MYTYLVSLKFSAFLDTSYKWLLFEIFLKRDLEVGNGDRGQLFSEFSTLAFKKSGLYNFYLVNPECRTTLLPATFLWGEMSFPVRENDSFSSQLRLSHEVKKIIIKNLVEQSETKHSKAVKCFLIYILSTTKQKEI